MKRIEEDENGQKHCTGQYFDYWGCIDQCVSGSTISIFILYSVCTMHKSLSHDLSFKTLNEASAGCRFRDSNILGWIAELNQGLNWCTYYLELLWGCH